MKPYTMSCYATQDDMIRDMRNTIMKAHNNMQQYLDKEEKAKNEFWTKRAEMGKQEHYNKNDYECLNRVIEKIEGRIEAIEFAMLQF